MKTSVSLLKLFLYALPVLFINCTQRTNSTSLSAPDVYAQATPYMAQDGDTGETKINTLSKQDYSREVSTDGQEHFLETIKQDILQGNFKQAKSKFDYVNKNFPPKGTSGVSFYSVEQQNLYDEIKLDFKAHRIMNAKHESNPSFQFISATNTTITHLKITNQTPYLMSFIFSGVHSITLNVDPGKWQVVSLEKGQYNTAATVISSLNIVHFAGVNNFKDGDYEVAYTIKDI